MFDVVTDIFGHFLDPRKRVYLGYLLVSVLIAILWLIFFRGKSFSNSIKFLFDKQIWFSKSSRADFFVFLINRCISIIISPVLITQMVIATAIFYWLHGVSWLQSGSLQHIPDYIIVMSFTISIFLLDDFSKYWVHRWMHKWPILWALHKVHHSAEVLTPLTVYRTHPLEGIVFTIRGTFTQGISISSFIFFFGNSVDLLTVLGANVFLFLFNTAGSNLRHSHIGIRYWSWLEYIFISPAQHQLHHSIDIAHHDKNFGAALAVWDYIFGSLHHSEEVESLHLGIETDDKNFNKLSTLYLSPVLEIIQIISRRTGNIFSKLKSIKR
ncbi:MAG: sterol desaturase family protein [Paracoccaceae bacterium]|nr:sterol desaturase family protein [Paracoccaceae bacterium]